MANVDRAFSDFEDKWDWIPPVVVIAALVFIFLFAYLNPQKNTQTKYGCTTYYQGDELVEECN